MSRSARWDQVTGNIIIIEIRQGLVIVWGAFVIANDQNQRVMMIPACFYQSDFLCQKSDSKIYLGSGNNLQFEYV
jgi:hypothetical protein